MKKAQGSSFATWTKRLQGKNSPFRRRDSPKDGFRSLWGSDSPSQELSPKQTVKDIPAAREDIHVERDGQAVERRERVERHATSPTTTMGLEGGIDQRDDPQSEHVVAKSRSGKDEEEIGTSNKPNVDVSNEDEIGSFGSMPVYDWATLVLETLPKRGDQNEQKLDDKQIDYRSETAFPFVMPDKENSTQATGHGHGEATRADVVIASRGASHEQNNGSSDNMTKPETIRLVDPDRLTNFKPSANHSPSSNELLEDEGGESSLLRKKSSIISPESAVSSVNSRTEENLAIGSTIGSRDQEGDKTFVASNEYCRNISQDEELGNQLTDAARADGLVHRVESGFHEGPRIGNLEPTVLEPPDSSCMRGDIEDGEHTTPFTGKGEVDTSGVRRKNTNDHTFDDVADSSVQQSQQSVNSSALEGHTQPFAQDHKPEIELWSNTKGSKNLKAFQADQSYDVTPAGMRMKTTRKFRENGALGRVKLKSKSKNKISLVGVGEIITSALSSNRRAQVDIDSPDVKHRSEGFLARSSVQGSQSTDAKTQPRVGTQSSHDQSYVNDDKVLRSDDRTTSGIEIIASEDIGMAVGRRDNEDGAAMTMTDFNSDRETNDKTRKTRKRDKTKKRLGKEGTEKTRDRSRRRRDKGKQKREKRSKRSLMTSSSDLSDVIEQCTCQEAADDSPVLCNAIAVEHNGEDGGCRDITYDLREMAIELVKKGPGVVINWLE